MVKIMCFSIVNHPIGMNRLEMIDFIKSNPYIHISHPLFSHDEYIFSMNDGNVYDEQGYLFEDWYSPNNITGRNGIRERIGGSWETGWYIKM